MKNLFLYILFSALFACSESPRNAAEPFPNFLAEDVEWISYEGVLFSKNGQPVLTELHLAPGTPGMDSYYKITESFSSSDSLKSFSGTISSRENIPFCLDHRSITSSSLSTRENCVRLCVENY